MSEFREECLVRLLQNEKELLRLTYVGRSEKYFHYRIEFVNTNPQELFAMTGRDPRDVDGEFELLDGSRVRFAEVAFNYAPSMSVEDMYVHYIGRYSPIPPEPKGLWAKFMQRFREPQSAVPPERAPLTWYWTSRKSIQWRLRSKEPEEFWIGVSELSDVGPKDASWAVQVAENYMQHPETNIRRTAASAVGELARCYGVASRRAVDLLSQLENQATDSLEKQAVERVLNEIRRFVSAENYI